MNVQLPLIQFWALMAGTPLAMMLTVLVGILVNNSTTSSKIETLRSDLQRVEGSLRSDLQRVESSLRSEIQRVEGVLSAKLEALTLRVKALEDAVHAPLVKS